MLLHVQADVHFYVPGDLSLEAATARPLVMPSQAHARATRHIVEAILSERRRLPCSAVIEANSVHIVKSAIEAGIGLAIVPLGLAARAVQDGRLIARRIACGGLMCTLGLFTSRNLASGTPSVRYF